MQRYGWLGIAGLLYGVATYALWRPVGGAVSCALFGLGIVVVTSAFGSPVSRVVAGAAAGVVGGITLLLVTVLVVPHDDITALLLAMGAGMWGTMGGLFGALGGWLAYVAKRILWNRTATRTVVH